MIMRLAKGNTVTLCREPNLDTQEHIAWVGDDGTAVFTLRKSGGTPDEASAELYSGLRYIADEGEWRTEVLRAAAAEDQQPLTLVTTSDTTGSKLTARVNQHYVALGYYCARPELITISRAGRAFMAEQSSRVNWCACGAQPLDIATEFAAMLYLATEIAAVIAPYRPWVPK